ncbi:MAG TPA: sugar phosphate isomerase/epimerase family protein [Candidatus Sulfotelmatobacter sp.]|nr:sugar phosphate isomerase/epimerase family protein [Candidatus Sulfotelmatobacter sp.]
MKLKLSCADFSFPLLSHEAALGVISLLGLRGVDIGLFAGRSHLRPEKELNRPEKSGSSLHLRLERQGLVASDIFLQVHDNFADFAVNHPEAKRREFARKQFLKTLDYTAAAGAKHVSLLPGVTFDGEARETSLGRAAEELSWRVEQAASMKLTVGIEPHVGSIVDAPGLAMELADRVPGLGLTLDYAHFTRAGMPDSEIEPLCARATHFHARCARKDRLQSSFKDNTIDFPGALKALNKHDFRGWIALEYVWIDWEHCNEVDVVSETVLLKGCLSDTAKKGLRS